MANPMDKAQELQQELRNSEEFAQLKQLHEDINNDEVAKKMLDNFRGLQMQLQQKQMNGEQISEEEVQQAQQQFEVVQQHEQIMKLMEEEQKMSQMVSEINKVVTQPLEELYGEGEQE
ncbi:YlbF family regulator [Alkalicoccus urumqiensis]|uniref:UPF0342 protein C6I21_13155 n=1 Tax=Alkalicoccus urumqiensis TaxID=1548213 RepID=A0A2P6MEC8_ALKUR|nr:YlbF family regulator [Alkalicoccus urumqiensis]PRO64649.1 hypothetical protein C6I21_13155 [Alkalicoccus urumqiensis]